MFKPEHPILENAPVFQDPWHAQVLAIADTMIAQGRFTAADWAQTLGAKLRAAERDNAPDNNATYYESAVAALEKLVVENTEIGPDLLASRKKAWEQAYLATPHGKPVKLPPEL